MLRLVLDSNIWLDWLVFDDPAVAPLKAAVAQGAAQVFIDEAVEAELVRVLGYPFGARTLDAQAQVAVLERCLRIAIKGKTAGDGGQDTIRHPSSTRHAVPLPVCRDPDDQKFLELALACGAGFLVTRDAALLELARNASRPVPFRIVTPREFAARNEGRATRAP